jgi:hypothetical protein
MLFDNGGSESLVGSVVVTATQNQGLPVEDWAERCLKKIVLVADDSDSIIRDQAIAFREQIRVVLIAYMKNAIRSDRTNLYNLLAQQGQGDMAALLQKLQQEI